MKDYPGAWAEYRVYEDGYVQLTRRIESPEAMAWTEKTRGMFAGLYRDYALGPLAARGRLYVDGNFRWPIVIERYRRLVEAVAAGTR